MAEVDLHRTPPVNLARLLGWATDSTAAPVSGDESALWLRAMLATSVPRLLGAAPEGTTGLSLEELLLATHPEPALLHGVKQWAKRLRGAADGGVPADVASVIYFAALAAGALRCVEPITRLDPATFTRGLRWCLEQSWVNASVRNLMEQALSTVVGAPNDRGTSAA